MKHHIRELRNLIVLKESKGDSGKWVRKSVLVVHDNDKVQVDAIVKGVFGIHKSGRYWSLVHVPSGLLLRKFDVRKYAMNAADTIIGVDPKFLHADVDEFLSLNKKHGGLFAKLSKDGTLIHPDSSKATANDNETLHKQQITKDTSVKKSKNINDTDEKFREFKWMDEFFRAAKLDETYAQRLYYAVVESVRRSNLNFDVGGWPTFRENISLRSTKIKRGSYVALDVLYFATLWAKEKNDEPYIQALLKSNYNKWVKIARDNDIESYPGEEMD